MLSGSSSESWLRDSPEGSSERGAYEAMVAKDRRQHFPDTFEELLAELRANGKAAAFGSDLPYLGNSHGLVSVTDLEEARFVQQSFGLQKDSEFRELFNACLLEMAESGTLKQILDTWTLRRKPEDLSERIFVEDPLVLGFWHVCFPVSVLGLGVTLATAILCGEWALRICY